MKSYCTKSILLIGFALLVWSAAACTQSKPAVPTPTLIPLDNSPIVAPSGETPGAPSGGSTPIDNATLVPIGGDQTPIAPSGSDATPVPPPLETLAPNVTPIIVEPTLFPTPTTVGDTGQPPMQPTPGASGGDTGSPAGGASGGACSNPYTVQPGEWFYAIARKCGVTPQALLAANPGMNPNVLRPGQTLNIPGGGTTGGAPPATQPTATTGGTQPPASGACPNPYTVQRGDTLFSIAQKCGTTVAAIQQANGIPAPEYIFPGQQLRIP
ncbi:MAG: hypothetical protein HDKAJFGB_02395 [Anaerolineae bacterium]|nr:hypothetical protein [Anaerolineae bacterium]